MALNNFTNSSNTSSDAAEDRLMNVITVLDMYITPILYVIGFPGNILSLIIWMQKRMRHSSGYYLAAIALDDLVFLALHMVLELHETWQVKVLDYPVICEGYPIVFLSSQFLSPFLVLAFTTERFISICHPFQREKYCTIKRAKIVIICITVSMLCLNAAHGYFWHFDDLGSCGPRLEIKSAYTIYTTTVDMLVFFVVPVSILVLNILVIREMRRISKVEHVQLQGPSQKTGATTVMLLAVSFYQILTTLPISIAYALYFEFNCDPTSCVPGDRHKIYALVLTIIKEYGITHYVFNIFIYISTGKMFRNELKKLFLRVFVKVAPKLTRKYSGLGKNTKGSERSRTWANGTNSNDRSTEETLL